MKQMPKTIDLIKLGKQKVLDWREKPTRGNFVQARDFFHVVTQDLAKKSSYFDSDAPLTFDEKAALSLALYVFEMTIANREHIYGSTANDIMRLLCKRDSVALLKNEPGGEQTLAWVMCYLSTNFTIDKNIYHDAESALQQYMRTLLENWSNTKLDNVGILDMPKVVSLIYGQACWDLYGNHPNAERDIGVLYDILYAVTQAKLPVVISSNTTPPSEATINLPINISM